MAGKTYHFYIKCDVAYGQKTKERIEEFKKIIEEQQFFNKNDRVLYIPSEKTFLVQEGDDGSVLNKLGFSL